MPCLKNHTNWDIGSVLLKTYMDHGVIVEETRNQILKHNTKQVLCAEYEIGNGLC